MLTRFFRIWLNRVSLDNGVVLLDGIEYLLLDNDFISILRLIEQSNDTVMSSNSRLILQIDPETLDKKDYHLLKRWMKQLSPNNI
jgi:two-component system cell cycle response regulator